MNIDIARIHAAARRDRALAMNRLVFAPLLALFRRPARPAPRKAAPAVPAACT
jgi:hypothetical protein